MPPHSPASDTPLTRHRAALCLLIVCLGTIASPMDSAVNVVFPRIISTFGRDLSDIRWVVISYVLTYASLLLIFGKLGDLFGYRAVFQAGLATNAAGIAACAFATSFEVLLAGRMLQGLGAALVLSCAPALATSFFDETKRTRVLGIYAAMLALGAAIGPLAGGVLVNSFDWGAVFWARLPFVFAALALSWLIPRRPGSGTRADLDPLGSVQLVMALCLILLAVSAHNGGAWTWLRPLSVALGLIILVLFIRRQMRRDNPIIRPALFKDAVFAVMNIASVIANHAAFAVVLIGPFYLVRIAGLKPTEVGLALALAGFGMVVGSSLAARIVHRVGSEAAALVAMATSAAGLGGIAAWSGDQSMLVMMLPLVVQGIGIGLFQVAYTDFITAALPIGDRGVAGSLAMLTRTLGIIAGAAGHAALHHHFAAAATAGGGDPSAAFMAGFRAVFICAAAILALAIAVGLLAFVSRKARSRHNDAHKPFPGPPS